MRWLRSLPWQTRPVRAKVEGKSQVWFLIHFFLKHWKFCWFHSLDFAFTIDSTLYLKYCNEKPWASLSTDRYSWSLLQKSSTGSCCNLTRGESAARERALHQCWGCLWFHMGEGRTAGSSHVLTSSFPMSGILTSLGMHRGRQMCITFCLQSWAMVNLIWTRNCTNIHLYNESSVSDFFNFMNLKPVFYSVPQAE